MSERIKSFSQQNDFRFLGLFDRIERLEKKVFKKAKPPATLNQQILLLHHLGMLDKLYQLPVSNVKKAELLSIILNGDASNSKKALEALPKGSESPLRLAFNYEFLRDTFENIELSDQLSNVIKILKEIETQKDK